MRMPLISRPAVLFLLIAMVLPGAAAAGKYDRLVLSEPGRAKLEDLARMEDSRVISGIGRYVSDPEPLIRLRCAETLGRSGRPAEAIPHLVRLSADGDEAVKLAAIYSLGLTMDKAALEPLGEIAKNGPKKLKIAALEALGLTRLKEASPILLEWTTTFHSSVRAGAVRALAVLGDSSAAEELAGGIHDPAAEVIEQTAYAIGRLGYRELDEELFELCGNENLWIVMRAIEALGRLRVDRAAEPAGDLLGHSNRMIRIKAAEALWRIGTDEAAEKLEPLLDSDDAYLKDLALRGIAASRRGKPFERVVALLSDPSYQVRRSAVEAAASTDAEKALPLLLDIVRRGGPYDRMTALEFIGMIGRKEDMLLLVETLDSSVNHLEREGAAAGLKRIENDELLFLPAGASGRTPFEALVDAAGGDDPVVAAMAVEALGGKRALGKDEVPGATGRLIEIFRSRGGREDCDRKLAIIAVFDDLSGEGDLSEGARRDIAALLREAAASEGDPRVARAAEETARRYGAKVTFDPGRTVGWDRGDYPWGAPALPLGMKKIRIMTKRGPVEIELYGDDAPNIVKSFLVLIEEDFFDGLNFHRVVPGFVVQGGCPRGDGWGDAGWFLRSQFNTHRYERGYVGVAHAGKDTPGSQFFITHLPQPHLDGRYTIIGKVTGGMEIVDRIEVGDTFGIEIVE